QVRSHSARYPPSTQSFRRRVTPSAKELVNRASRPCRSSTWAAVTTTATTSPSVSTKRWRLRPLTFLFPSNLTPLLWVAVLTLWLSMAPADGSARRPWHRRSTWRSSVITRSHTLVRRQRRKEPQTVSHGPKSLGSMRHWQPVLFTDKMLLNTRRSGR